MLGGYLKFKRYGGYWVGEVPTEEGEMVRKEACGSGIGTGEWGWSTGGLHGDMYRYTVQEAQQYGKVCA